MTKPTIKHTPVYTIRQLPAELWLRAKHRAVDRGISLNKLIRQALEEYLGKGDL